MKIGILGTGNVGANLGRSLAKTGHSVLFGTRSPHSERVSNLVLETLGGAGSISEAVEYGEVVFLALPWPIAEGILQSIDMSGKVVVDMMNAVVWDHGPVPGVEDSVAEMVAALQPKAKVIKAFNSVAAEHLSDPVFRGHHVDVYICGNDASAKKTIMEMAESIGFHPVDAGPLRNSKLVEQMAILWIHLTSIGNLGRDMAFKLLSK